MSKIISQISFIILLVFTLTSCEKSNPVEQEEHFEPMGLIIRDATKAVYMKLWEGKLDTAYYSKISILDTGLTDAFYVTFLNDKKEEIEAPESAKLAYIVSDISIANVYQHQGEEGDTEFHLIPKKVGITDIEIRVLHNDHSDFKTPKISLEVKK